MTHSSSPLAFSQTAGSLIFQLSRRRRRAFAICITVLLIALWLSTPTTLTHTGSRPARKLANKDALDRLQGSVGESELPIQEPARSCYATTKEITCKTDGSGSYLYSFVVTNNTGETVTSALLTPPPNSNFTITSQTPPLPGGSLATGQQVTLPLTITGGQPGQNICFNVTLMTKEKNCCTVELCVTLPDCCATLKTEKIECSANGYTYTFSATNNTASTIENIYLYPTAGVTLTPNYFSVSLAPGAASGPLTVTIAGAPPGSFCFNASFHTKGMKACCTINQCITLPDCNLTADCADGRCCSRAPSYPGFTSSKVSAMTGQWQSEVLTVFDFSGANAFPTNANSAPTRYHGPASQPWNLANLGTIFGLTIDHLGNIYVTASSAYNGDSYPGAGGAGRIYKIANGTGTISVFATLPNTLDPSILPTSEAYPALGNISMDCGSKQFFVTNQDDGRIYRLSLAGVVLSTFDHATGTVAAGGAPEPGDAPGFAPLGERLWAVQFHNQRVYYSVWFEDCGNKNANGLVKNAIWSIAINATTGEFISGSKRFELNVPDLAGETFSNPTSDISFSRDGKMLLAERTMYSSTSGKAATTVNAHASRVLEFFCRPPTLTVPRWTLTSPISGSLYRYNVGIAAFSGCQVGSAQPANAAGGIDYDFGPTAQYGVWATGDALKFGPLIYGLQGFPSAGATVTNSALIDWLGLFQGDKMRIGDVEVSCPPGFIAY